MQVYHVHTSYSNINTPFKDSAMLPEDHAKRAVELGQGILSTCEHGYAGNFMKTYNVAEQYGLKYLFCAELYWVRDRSEKDATNAHIIVIAKNMNGVKQINRIISEANLTGYYKVARVDIELLKQLDPNDVCITTACVGFWSKVNKTTGEPVWHYATENDHSNRNILNIWKELYDHFGDSMFLEVQCHNTVFQKAINSLVLSLHRKYGIPLILGTDSHYVYPEQKIERQYLREESGVKMTDDDYEYADNVYEDYPDEETIRQRMKVQGILSDTEIQEAIDATDMFLFFEDIRFDKSRKLPTLFNGKCKGFPKLTQEERNQLYLDTVMERWNEYKKNVDPSRWAEYEKSFMEEEVNIILDNDMADYFLLDMNLIRRGKELGGRATRTGRGSASSFFTNTLLGLSTINRFELPVQLFPARFLTAERLRSGSTPDIDMNLDRPDIFAKAQEELLGEGHSYPMVAYQTLGVKSSFKMYARVKGVAPDIANEVSKKIGAYEEAVKQADDEDEKDSIDIADYVGEEFMPYITASETYRGIVVGKSQAPCGYLISNLDIQSEIGIMRINADNGKKIVYTTVVDGIAEAFGFVKNDLLGVTVIKINEMAMERAGIQALSSVDIIEKTKTDPKVWNLLAQGYTQGINQVQQPGATDKLMLYKPTCLQEFSAFIAAIRPGFKSMLQKFLHRQKFSYGIPAFDDLLHTDTTGSSWLMYQEQLLKLFILSGFDKGEGSGLIKSISKKKYKVIKAAEPRFIEGFSAYIKTQENKSDDECIALANDVWKIVLDSASYLFAAAHAVSVAIDALYGAYLKANYPYEYYSVLLDVYSDKGNKDKVTLIKSEMKKAFGIKTAPCRFRQDNRSFFVDKEHQQIANALHSIKYLSQAMAQELYDLRENHYPTFIDLLMDLQQCKAVNNRPISILIRLGYFSEFGKAKKLYRLFDEFNGNEGSTLKCKITKTLKPETIAKRKAALVALERSLPDEDYPMEQQLSFETEYLGTPLSVYPNTGYTCSVIDVETKFSPKIKLYCASTGTTNVFKIKKAMYQSDPVVKGDTIKVSLNRKPAFSYSNGHRIRRDGVFDWWITSFNFLYQNPNERKVANG